jgi:predicted neuraminidase/dihydrodipicolinate synthase/N-acetylneuraminate lyase
MHQPFELYPTIVTPFNTSGQIDYVSLDRLISHMLRNHCDGLFAVCQSSEMFLLSEDERLELAAFCISRCHALGRTCVVSGHTQDRLEDQIAYLLKVEQLHPDAIILVTNRLAKEAEPDTVLMNSLTEILIHLKSTTRLGLYECPYPYKRLLTGDVIGFLVKTGRFDFIKDTSCHINTIRSRLHQIAGSSIRLYNANAATLMESVISGAAGYSGVMLNFFPELFAVMKRYLCAGDALNDRSPLQYHVRSAGEIASFITLASVFETQNYPVNAKHYLKMKGIIDYTVTRKLDDKWISESQEKELISLANHVEKQLSKFDHDHPRELIFDAGLHFRCCHASTVLPQQDGTILVAYFSGTSEGNEDVGIWLSRRIQGIWQNPVCIVPAEGIPHWNPVLFQTGRNICLVYKVGRSVQDWKSRTIQSTDNGITWSRDTAFPAPNIAGGPVRSKPIRLSSGQLLAANSDETHTDWRPRVDISPDNGQNFHCLAWIPLNKDRPDQDDYISGKGAIQPTLWESQPGHIHMLLRTTCGWIFRSDSEDDGKTWCQAYNTHLPNNNSGIEIAQDDSVLYLVMNPISGNWASRNPLVIQRSFDNGRTFDHFLTLDSDPVDPELLIDAEYSYPAAVVLNHRLHVTYTYLRRQIAYSAIELNHTVE